MPCQAYLRHPICNCHTYLQSHLQLPYIYATQSLLHSTMHLCNPICNCHIFAIPFVFYHASLQSRLYSATLICDMPRSQWDCRFCACHFFSKSFLRATYRTLHVNKTENNYRVGILTRPLDGGDKKVNFMLGASKTTIDTGINRLLLASLNSTN